MDMEAQLETTEKINRAVKLLKEASSESLDDTQASVMEKFNYAKEKAASKATEMKKQAIGQAKAINDKAKETPWKFIGGAAVIAGTLGYIFGKKK